MTRRTIQELIDQANASLPDNNAELISPADVRSMVVDFLDTMTPMYGGLFCESITLNATTSPQVLTFTQTISSFPPEWTVNPAAGIISRQLLTVPAMVSRIYVGAIAEGPNNREIRIHLYKNNEPTAWATEETLAGTSNSSALGFVAVDYGLVDAVYTLKLSLAASSGNPFSVTLRSMYFIAENVPVRTIPEPPPPGSVGFLT